MPTMIEKYSKAKPLDGMTVCLIAFALTYIAFQFQANIGINLSDEGFLWYGTWRTSLGEIPKLDFKAYDPGRYFWAAGWSFVFGDGIIALRSSVSLFQALGLSFGLLSLRRIMPSYFLITICGVFLILWMYPRHKLFEHSIAMASVFFAATLMDKPTLKRHFFSGLFVGFSAFFGRNHGVYSFLAFFFIILFAKGGLSIAETVKKYVYWGMGIIVGYSPMLLMFLFIDGFWDAFLENILLIQHRDGSLNISRPVPWPWKNLQFDVQFFIGVFFLIIPVFYCIVGLYYVFKKTIANQKWNLGFSSLFVGIFWMHHAFSRADVSHLAQAIHPFLICLFATFSVLKGATIKYLYLAVMVCILIASFFVFKSINPFYIKSSSPKNFYQHIEISHGDKLWVRRYNSNIVSVSKHISKNFVQKDEALLVAPYLPGVYSLLSRKSPFHENFFLWPMPNHVQKQQIDHLKKGNVNWLMIGDIKLDGRDDLRFMNTHRMLWQYILLNYDVVKLEDLPKNYTLFRKRLPNQM